MFCNYPTGGKKVNIFDFIICFIVILGAYNGFKNGLIKSIGGVVGWVASIVVAVTYNGNLADYLDKQFDLVARFGEIIMKVFPLPNFSFEAENINKAVVNAGVQEMALPDFLKTSLIENIDQLALTGNYFDVSLSEIIAYGLAGMFLKGFSILILFVITGIIINVGISFLSGLFSFTPLGPINKMSGAVLGLIINIAVLAIIMGLLSPMVILSASQNGNIAGIIQTSYSFAYLLELFTLISFYFWVN